jgi:hypothetical protein
MHDYSSKNKFNAAELNKNFKDSMYSPQHTIMHMLINQMFNILSAAEIRLSEI